MLFSLLSLPLAFPTLSLPPSLSLSLTVSLSLILLHVLVPSVATAMLVSASCRVGGFVSYVNTHSRVSSFIPFKFVAFLYCLCLNCVSRRTQVCPSSPTPWVLRGGTEGVKNILWAILCKLNLVFGICSLSSCASSSSLPVCCRIIRQGIRVAKEFAVLCVFGVLTQAVSLYPVGRELRVW